MSNAPAVYRKIPFDEWFELLTGLAPQSWLKPERFVQVGPERYVSSAAPAYGENRWPASFSEWLKLGHGRPSLAGTPEGTHFVLYADCPGGAVGVRVDMRPEQGAEVTEPGARSLAPAMQGVDGVFAAISASQGKLTEGALAFEGGRLEAGWTAHYGGHKQRFHLSLEVKAPELWSRLAGMVAAAK